MNKRITLILIISIMLCCILQCSKPVTHKVIVVLVDLSESTNKPQMRDLYISSFKKIVDLVSNEDSLFVAPITEKSIMELNFVIEEPNLVPAGIDYDTNYMQEKRLREEAKAKLEAKKEEMLNTFRKVVGNQERKIYKTDILSSLNMADERVFRGLVGNDYTKMLVIMSDMMEDSDVYNFEKQKLPDSKVDEIISTRKEKGLLPSLSGVKVYVVGSNAPSVEKYNDIKNFWFKYLKEAGAVIEAENYSSSCPVRICQ